MGEVWRGLDMLTGKEVAIKGFNSGAAQTKAFEKEHHIHCMVQRNQANGIVQLLDYDDQNSTKFLIMEFASKGELWDLVAEQTEHTDGSWSVGKAMDLFWQLVDSVAEIHSQNVAHLDISLENFLLFERGNVKVCDFGLAMEVRPDYEAASEAAEATGEGLHPTPPVAIAAPSASPVSNAASKDLRDPCVASLPRSPMQHPMQHQRELSRSGKLKSKASPGVIIHQPIGKLCYMAPEIANPALQRSYGSYDPRSADVYSLGICLFVMLLGFYPYKFPTKRDCRFGVLLNRGLRDLMTCYRMEGLLSEEALSLLERMLCYHPKRLSIEQVQSLRGSMFSVQPMETSSPCSASP